MSKPDAALPPELIIDLDPPISIGESSYDQLVLREPTAGEMRAIRARPLNDQQIAGVALIAGVPEKAVERMPISKIVEAEQYLVGFTIAAPKTGGD